MANDLQLLNVQGEMAYVFDFSDILPSTSPLTVVTGIVVSAEGSPLPLTVGSQTDDLTNARTTVILSGIRHGDVVTIQALATLSNGEVIPKDATFVGFNA